MIHTLYKFFRAFRFAFRGIWVAFKERNMRVHGLALVAVFLAGWWLQLSVAEWLAIVMISGAVMAAEVINTAIESVCNVMRDQLGASYDSSKDARDLAAGAVLVLAITALIIAVLIFGPKLVSLLVI